MSVSIDCDKISQYNNGYICSIYYKYGNDFDVHYIFEENVLELLVRKMRNNKLAVLL